MSLNYTKNFVLLLVILLFPFPSSNATGDVQLIPMQQIGEDTTGDGVSLGYDISSAYAASFNGMLMLTVAYAEIGVWGLYSNITLRNSDGDLHLIMVYTNQGYGDIIIVEATSLEDDSLNTNGETYFSYEETWRVHTNFTEITFFIDWADIGGEGPIDLVFWTGRPMDNPDKLPNTGHLSFDGVKTVGTTGYLGEPIIISTTATTESLTYETTSIVNEVTITESSGGSNLPNVYLIVVLILIVGGILFYKYYYTKSTPSIPTKQKYVSAEIKRPDINRSLCSSCGTINLADSSYCMECGTYLGK